MLGPIIADDATFFGGLNPTDNGSQEFRNSIIVLGSTDDNSRFSAPTSLNSSSGHVAILLFNRYHRGWAAACLGLLVIATTVVLQTNRGTFLAAWYDRTFSPARTLAQRTSGRSDQWSMFPEVMKDVPLWGFGPGSGQDVHARYSALKTHVKLRAGSRLRWHSLYQQLAVETGVIGSAALLLLLIHMLKGNYRWWHDDGVITPLLGTVGFMLIAATVSGMDGASGLFLGLGLLPRQLRGGGVGAGATKGAGQQPAAPEQVFRPIVRSRSVRER